MTDIHSPISRNQFTEQDRKLLAGIAGSATERGRIGAVEFIQNDEGGDIASLMASWGDGGALYGIGMGPEGYHLIDSSDGETLAEAESLEEVLRGLAA